MIKSDEYMHGGITHPLWNTISDHNHHEHEGNCQSRKKIESMGKAAKIPGWNILLALADKIDIKDHIHLEGEDSIEMIPWYVYATKLDKHNTHAYALAGYWLNEVLGDSLKAFNFLLEGVEHNPDSWEIHKQIAMIYYVNEKDYLKALRYFANSYKNIKGIKKEAHERQGLRIFMIECFENLRPSKEAEMIIDELKDYE